MLPLQIDLDTIETSNLNRQFLFRRSHVGQSKAQVAAEVVKGFAPYANITAYQVGVGDGGMGAGNDDLQVAAPMLGLSLCARHLLPDRVKA